MTTLVHLAIADLVRPAARLPVSDDRVAELAESVARVGLLQPLVVPQGRGYRLVAGRHRLEAVTRLGWPTVPCVVLDLGRVQEQLAEVDENLIRRSLSYLDRAELIARRVELLDALGHQRRGRPRKSAPGAGYSPTLTARTSCLSPRSVRLACQVVAGLPREVRDQVRGTKAAESSKQLLALTRLPADEQREVARLLATGDHRRVGAATVAARRRLIHADPGGPTPGIELHLTDFRVLPVPPHSARLVLTDPPWAGEWLPNWSDLSEWAARVLAPGGVFVSYVGIQHLPEVMRVAGAHLRYTWTLAGVRPGGCRLIPFNGVMTSWQPVVLFTNGPPAALSMPDVVPRAAKEKSHHVWQQPAAEAEFLIERLTRPDDLVVDGCVGSGTVAATSSAGTSTRRPSGRRERGSAKTATPNTRLATPLREVPVHTSLTRGTRSRLRRGQRGESEGRIAGNLRTFKRVEGFLRPEPVHTVRRSSGRCRRDGGHHLHPPPWR